MRWRNSGASCGTWVAKPRVVLAINPRNRQDWALENALSVAFVAALVLFRHRLPFSRISYMALFLFLTLHTSRHTTRTPRCPTTNGAGP